MATLTREDLITRRAELVSRRDELLKDIDALDRVLKLFNAEPGGLIPPPPKPPEIAQMQSLSHDLHTPPTGLKGLIIEGLRLQADIGATPKDLLIFVKSKGYQFTSDVNGTASISTALSRMVDDDKVRKQHGRYYWVG